MTYQRHFFEEIKPVLLIGCRLTESILFFLNMARRRKRKQRGGWLNRYDFAYADRDSVNQAAYHVKK